MSGYLVLVFALGYALARRQQSVKPATSETGTPTCVDYDVPGGIIVGQKLEHDPASVSTFNDDWDTPSLPPNPAITVEAEKRGVWDTTGPEQEKQIHHWDDDGPDDLPPSFNTNAGSQPVPVPSSHPSTIRSGADNPWDYDAHGRRWDGVSSGGGARWENSYPSHLFQARERDKPPHLSWDDDSRECASVRRSVPGIMMRDSDSKLDSLTSVSRRGGGSALKCGMPKPTPVSCEICEEVQASTLHLRKHKTETHSWSMLCTQCLVTFRTGHIALEHYKSIHDAPSIDFESVASFLEHERKGDDEIEMPPDDTTGNECSAVSCGSSAQHNPNGEPAFASTAIETTCTTEWPEVYATETLQPPRLPCNTCWADFLTPEELQKHSLSLCGTAPPPFTPDYFPPMTPSSSGGPSARQAKVNPLSMLVLPLPGSHQSENASSAGSGSPTYPPSEVPDGATPDELQRGARLILPPALNAPSVWKARPTIHPPLTKRNDHPAYQTREPNPQTNIRRVPAASRPPHNVLGRNPKRQVSSSSVIAGAKRSLNLSDRSHAKLPLVPQHILASFPDDQFDHSDLVEQVPCFDFPENPSEYCAYDYNDDKSPALTSDTNPPRVVPAVTTPSASSTELATPTTSATPSSPMSLSRLTSPSPITESSARRKIVPTNDCTSGLPQQPDSRARAAYEENGHAYNWMEFHPSNDPPPPLTPPRLSMTLADIARRGKPKELKSGPKQARGKKSSAIVVTQPVADLMQPRFEEDWVTFGGVATRGGQGGAKVLSDGWEGVGVYTSGQRFGGW